MILNCRFQFGPLEGSLDSTEPSARAQSLCASAVEKLRIAEMRAEAAERAQRELIITAEHKLQDACRALEQASRVLKPMKIS
jgi:hypothetical protein